LDPAAYRSDIDGALTRTQALKARTAYESFVQSLAKELQNSLRRGDETEFAAQVRKFQGYPD
jgi:hypothetical protein